MDQDFSLPIWCFPLQSSILPISPFLSSAPLPPVDMTDTGSSTQSPRPKWPKISFFFSFFLTSTGSAQKLKNHAHSPRVIAPSENVRSSQFFEKLTVRPSEMGQSATRTSADIIFVRKKIMRNVFFVLVTISTQKELQELGFGQKSSFFILLSSVQL